MVVIRVTANFHYRSPGLFNVRATHIDRFHDLTAGLNMSCMVKRQCAYGNFKQVLQIHK